MNDEELIRLLDQRFGYTTDNNRDLITDSSFPHTDALEEIQLEAAYKVLVADLARTTPDQSNTFWED